MKNKLLWAFTLLIFCATSPAFADVEPNDNIAQAEAASLGAALAGSLSVADQNDYYRFILPENGTVSASATLVGGTARIYLYNKAGSQLTFSGVTATPSISISCVAADTFYVRLNWGGTPSTYSMTVDLSSPAEAADVEPNDGFLDAVSLALGAVAEGHSGFVNGGATDIHDMYAVPVTGDGKLVSTLIVSGSLTARIYYFWGSTSLMTFSGVTGDTITLEADCIAADTLYVRVSRNGGCGGYSLEVNLVPVPVSNDNEPNNVLGEALPLAQNSTKTGHLGYMVSGVADGSDWYVLLPSASGLFRTVAYNDNTLSTRIYLYDKNGVLITFSAVGTDSATLSADCILNDTLYVQVFRNGGCGGYQLSYDMTPPTYSPDAEPNSIISQSIEIPFGSEVTGQLGYANGSGTVDPADWYYTVLPNDGRLDLALYTLETLTSRVYLYDKNGSLLTFSAVGVDTVYLSQDCLSSDTVYLQVFRNSGCGSYRLVHALDTPQVIRDAEPNNVIAEAIPSSSSSDVFGHLGYANGSGTLDVADWFRFIVPGDGKRTARLIPQESLTARLYIYDRNGSLITFSAVSGDTVEVSVNCLAADTAYLLVSLNSGCGGYTFQQELDAPAEPNDAEPNDVLLESVSYVPNTVARGHLGYVNGAGTLDSHDWYEFSISDTTVATFTADFSESLTGRIYVMNDVGGVLTFSAAGDSVWVGYTYNIPGTYYLRVSHNGGCGGYALSTDFGYCVSDAAPVNLTSNVTASKAFMYWDPIRYSTACQVQGRPQGTSSWAKRNKSGFEISSTSVPLNILSPGTIYEWRVRCACNTSPVDATGFSVIRTFVTPAPRLGQSDALEQSVELVPNPADANVTVSLSGFAGEVSIQLIDLAGRVLQQRRADSMIGQVRLATESLVDGLYLIRVESDGGSAIERLLINH